MDQCADGGHQDGHHGRLEHAGRAGAHIAEQFCRLCRPGHEHDKGTGDDTDQQDDEYIDPKDPAEQYKHIGDDLDQVILFDDRVSDLRVQCL